MSINVDTHQPYPTIAVVDYGGTPNPDPPLQLGKPPPHTKTYLVQLFPRLPSEEMSIMVVEDTLPAEIPEDIVAAIRYETDGSLFLESFNASKSVNVLTEYANRTIRIKLPVSAVGSERFYCMLTRDCEVEITGVTQSRISFVYDSTEIKARSSGFQPPQVQVMHSLSPKHEPTPAAMPSTITQGDSNLKVLETPKVESRHIDPKNSPHRRLQVSPTKERIQQTRSGLMLHGIPATNEIDFTQSSPEDPFVATAPLDTAMDMEEPYRIESTVGDRSPSRQQTAPVADMGLERITMSPTESIASPMKGSPDNDGHVELDENGLPPPEVLPEYFKAAVEKIKYKEEKKQKTPAKQYGRKAAASKQRKEDTEAHRNARRSTTAETEAGAAPLAAAQKKGTGAGRGTKRKATVEVRDEDEETADEAVVVKRRKGKGSSPVPAPTEEDEPVPKSTKGRNKGKQKAREVVTEEEEPFSIALEESAHNSTSEEPPRKGSRKSSRQTAEAAATKVPKATPGDTQYTFPDSSAEEGDEEAAAAVVLKTPKARGKVPAKTPAAKKIPASARRKKATPRAQSTHVPENGGTPPTTLRTTDHYDGSPPRISFSSSLLGEDKATQKFIRANSGKVLSTPADPTCNYLVVGELKRTPKFIIAIARGVRIVEDAWLKDSAAAGYFVDPDRYVPNDPEREAEWGCKLSEAVERGSKGETQVLKGMTVYLTPSLLSYLKATKSEEGLMDILKAAGAENVYKKAPRGGVEKDTLVLGKEEGEKDLATLEKAGWKVYTTFVIGLGVIRGALEMDDEFLVKSGAASQEEKKGRGGRKPLA